MYVCLDVGERVATSGDGIDANTIDVLQNGKIKMNSDLKNVKKKNNLKTFNGIELNQNSVKVTGLTVAMKVFGFYADFNYSGNQKITMGTRKSQWEPENYSGNQKITVGTRKLQSGPENYSGNQTITVGTRKLHWEPENYIGNQKITVGTINYSANQKTEK